MSSVVLAAPDNNSGAASSAQSVVRRFVEEKFNLEETLAKKHGVEVPSDVMAFFDAARSEQWVSASNWFISIQAMRNYPPRWKPEFWGPVNDTFGALDIFRQMDPELFETCGMDLVKGIPPGSIYFGGSDVGRFLPSVYSESHSEGRPFFTLTQNQLADPAYLGYIGDMYAGKINLADTNDSVQSFSNYTADAEVRYHHDQDYPDEPHQIKPGENVRLDSTGHARVSGQVAVMGINALLARVIFERNPTNQFFVEESFPLEWMFPHLLPSGLVMKINRAPLSRLDKDIFKQDHEFWTGYTARLIGNWITYDTPVKDIAAFDENVYLKKDFSQFHGDLKFIRDSESQRFLSKLRCSIAGIYNWRLGMSPGGDTVPKQYIAAGTNRMLLQREADFAFKQAFALCPASPEAIYRYVQLLVNSQRIDDAMLVAETAREFAPTNQQFSFLMTNLVAIKGRLQSRNETTNEIAELENEVKANPTNFTKELELANKYFKIGQKQRCYELLDEILANPDVTAPVVVSIANAYAQLGQVQKIKLAMEELTQLEPESPEAWYDLAAARASLGEGIGAIDALTKALDCNARRQEKSPGSKDLRIVLKTDRRFDKLRGSAEFKALVPSP